MKKNKTMASLLSLSLLTVMSGAAVAPALGAIQADFNSVNPILIKLVITTPALFIILTSFFFGRLAGRFKSRQLTLL